MSAYAIGETVAYRTSATSSAPRHLAVLHASQTGCGVEVAEGLAREAELLHFEVQHASVDGFGAARLAEAGLVILVVSTSGQGEAPDSMRETWRWLLRKTLPADTFAGTDFAVFGLGDSSYPKFNAAARRLRARLAQLGGRVIAPESAWLGDDQEAAGYDLALDAWRAAVWPALLRLRPLPPGVAPKAASARMPRLTVAPCEPTPGAGQRPASASEPIGPRNPFLARLLVNRRITAAGHFQDVRHLEIDLGGSGLEFAPGDALALLPRNTEAVGREFCELMSLDAEQCVQLAAVESRWAEEIPRCCDARGQCSVLQLVMASLDVQGIPRRGFFEQLAPYAEGRDQQRLQYFASAEGRAERVQYTQRDKHSILGLFRDFPSVRLDLEALVLIVPRIQPRCAGAARANCMLCTLTSDTSAITGCSASPPRTARRRRVPSSASRWWSTRRPT